MLGDLGVVVAVWDVSGGWRAILGAFGCVLEGFLRSLGSAEAVPLSEAGLGGATERNLRADSYLKM